MKYNVEILTDTRAYNCSLDKKDPMEALQYIQDTLAARMPFMTDKGLFCIELGAKVKHIIIEADSPAVEPVKVDQVQQLPAAGIEDIHTKYLGATVQVTLVKWNNGETIYVLPLTINKKPAYDEADPPTIKRIVGTWIDEHHITNYEIELPPQQLPDIEEAVDWLRDKYPVQFYKPAGQRDAKAWHDWKGAKQC